MSPTTSAKYLNAADCPALTLLYDGGCPLCLREVELLGRKDRQRHGEKLKLAFVDIDQYDYNPDSYAGISYREAMGRIHAIDASGAVLRDVEVWRNPKSRTTGHRAAIKEFDGINKHHYWIVATAR